MEFRKIRAYMAAFRVLSLVAAAAASPLSVFEARVGGDPTFCFPSTGFFHLRFSSINVRGDSVLRADSEQFADNTAGKERIDNFEAVGAFKPAPTFTTIFDYKAGFAWRYDVRTKTCNKIAAGPKPGPNTQCGAPDGVTFASTGTQGPVDVTIFRSVQVTPEYNFTYTWHVAGDVPTIDSILHFSASFQNETFADYQRTEVEDVVRSR